MTRDYELYPDDDNGNVLWQMAEDGDDLSEPHEIEYSIAFQEQSQAEKCALYLLQEEQKITLFVDEESDVSEWIITIYVYMEPEYSDIVDLEQWFTKIAEGFTHIVICSHVQAKHTINFFRTCSDHNNRQIRLFTDFTANGQAIHTRHHQV